MDHHPLNQKSACRKKREREKGKGRVAEGSYTRELITGTNASRESAASNSVKASAMMSGGRVSKVNPQMGYGRVNVCLWIDVAKTVVGVFTGNV